MPFRAKTREEATAYFDGWTAAEMDDKGVGNGKVERPRRPLCDRRLIYAFDYGRMDYNLYARC